MKGFLLTLIVTLTLIIPEISYAQEHKHTATSGELNNAALKQIESLIRKKAGAEFQKNNKNSFTLNGYNVYTETVEKNYAPSIYEESFWEIKNPVNEFKMRLVINPNGEQELAVMIYEDGAYINYHACFDSNGNMFENDPWGNGNEYSIEIFNLYKKYRILFAQNVDHVNTNQQDICSYISQSL